MVPYIMWIFRIHNTCTSKRNRNFLTKSLIFRERFRDVRVHTRIHIYNLQTVTNLMFRIRGILWFSYESLIRTLHYGSRSGSISFLQWLSRCPQEKIRIFLSFSLYIVGTLTSVFKANTSLRSLTTVEIMVYLNVVACCIYGTGTLMPKNIWILLIRIRNTEHTLQRNFDF